MISASYGMIDAPREFCETPRIGKEGEGMRFFELLTVIIALFQREGRVSYRALKLEFALDEEHLEALRDELIYAKRLATDEEAESRLVGE